MKLIGLPGASVVRHRYLLPLTVGVLVVVVLWARSQSAGDRLYGVVALVAAALVAQPVLRLVGHAIESEKFEREHEAREVACTLRVPEGEPLRDVYLIVMDAYERDDVLREMHGYDNTPFLDPLRAMGFYVAAGSLSNYRHTEISLTSILNLDYIQAFPESYSESSDNRNGLVAMIKDSRLRRELECLGYVTVSFETGVYWTEWTNADYFITQAGGSLSSPEFFGGLTRFETFLLRTSIARALMDFSSRVQQSQEVLSNDPIEDHRERILFALDQLSHVASLPSPKLVFVHILSPHPPMVFGRNGEHVNEGEFETGRTDEQVERLLLEAYADQVEFLNGRLLEAVQSIKAASEAPPIIIILGDHGWAERNLEDKLSILNAYHLPGLEPSWLYPTITPVNTFRVIFDRYFGAELGLLDDVSYFSFEDGIFKFELVENTWSSPDS